jgi:FMN-dependent oxidoreductase (nitrilotriacetate monooxygenase family)
MRSKREMKLAVSMATLGYHPAAWRHPAVPADGMMRFKHHVEVARTAQRGLFDMLFLADSAAVRNVDEPLVARIREQQVVKHEPLTLLAALAAVTENIGLVATASTTYSEPFGLARRFATIDHISGGRAGWNIVTGFSGDEARNFSLEAKRDSAWRYSRAHEFVDVVKGLWNSWDAEALVRNKQSGTFYDRSRMHMLNHRGEHFSVRGPLDVDRSPQGCPVLVTAGDSEQSKELAAKFGEVLYAGQPTLASAQSYYADVKGRMAAYGRAPGSMLVMPGIMVFVGRAESEARQKLRDLHDLIHPEQGLGLIAPMFGDFSGHDLDGPVPAEVGQNTLEWSSFSKDVLARVRREGLTIRQLYELLAEGYWQLGIVGTPEMVADRLEEWFKEGAADGFNVQPPYLPGALEDFVDLVVPELQRRGLFRKRYEGVMLRDNLGLARVN